ncbi:hypothetical protein AC579_5726 [Pseudocercospora musae]|uniref:Uncharacterized protein n=1 Tax=Pseudocercospora musae TaxID=113226 RepID=A0A139IRN3_9PEZI|nr:hypothetical protein AC579_5726 [Pseudocercospora musae]
MALDLWIRFSMWLGWTAVVAAEATFFSWTENGVDDAMGYTVFLVIMLVTFALPNTFFAWFEYATSIMKLLALFIFILAGLCCSLYTGCLFHLALYPIGSDSPSAYSFLRYMIGTVRILGLENTHQVVFRTKLRDPKKVDSAKWSAIIE